MLVRSLRLLALAVLTAVAPLAASSAFALTPSPPSLAKAGEITFCTELGQPPAAYIDADGMTSVGFEVDLMKAIGSELGLKTRIINYKLAGLLGALDSNKCDAVMATMGVTPERLNRYNYVEYIKSASGLLVPRGNPLRLQTYEDLSARRVAVNQGSSNERRLKEASERLVKAGRPPINILTYPTYAVAFRELEMGRVDAFASAALTRSYYLSRSSGRFEIGGTPVPPNPFGIMLRKTDVEEAFAIRDAWRALLADGTVQKIVGKWGAEQAGPLCDGYCDHPGASGLAGGVEPPKPGEAQAARAPVRFDVPFFLDFVFRPSQALLRGLGLTILAAGVSLACGASLGILLAIGGLSRFKALHAFNQLFVGFFRGTPVLVQLVLIYFGVPALMGGVDIFPATMSILGLRLSGALVAGIVTFSLHEAAYMSEIFRAGIQSIDIGQGEAAKSLGMPPGLAMRRIILPQAFRVIVPPLGNQFNIMLKTTSLLSVIAIPELFHVADAVQSATYKSFEVYLGVSIYYLALTGSWTLIQRQIEARMRSGKVRVAPAAGGDLGLSRR